MPKNSSSVKTTFLILISFSSSFRYLIIIPLFVHSFKSAGNTSSPIIPLIIVVFPSFEGPKKGIKITFYILKNSTVLYISLIIFIISLDINWDF